MVEQFLRYSGLATPLL